MLIVYRYVDIYRYVVLYYYVLCIMYYVLCCAVLLTYRYTINFLGMEYISNDFIQIKYHF